MLVTEKIHVLPLHVAAQTDELLRQSRALSEPLFRHALVVFRPVRRLARLGVPENLFVFLWRVAAPNLTDSFIFSRFTICSWTALSSPARCLSSLFSSACFFASSICRNSSDSFSSFSLSTPTSRRFSPVHSSINPLSPASCSSINLTS